MALPTHEPAVLGHILMLQSSFEAAPTERHLSEMLEQGLKTLPGVRDVKFLPFGEEEKPSSAEEPPVRLAARSRNDRYGEFRIALSSGEQFYPYLPFVSNTVNLCAFQIERMRTQELLHQANRQLERLAEERNERYKLLFQEMSDGVLHLDGSGKVMSANDAARSILGMDEDFSWRFSVREDGSEFPASELPWSKTLKDGIAVSSVVLGVTNAQSGLPVWLEIDTVPFGAHGSGRSVFVLFKDITGRRRAEAALLASEQRFRTIMDHAPIGMSITSIEGRIQMVNESFCSMLGYSREELEGGTFLEITHPEDREVTNASREDLLAGRSDAYEAEKRYVRKDGNVIWGHLVSTIVRGGDVPYFIAQVQDITERKRTEAELLIAATTFDSQNGVMITDADLRILRVNKAFTEITGYEPEEIVGKHPRMLQSGRHDARFYEQMWSGIRSSGKWVGEVWNRRKDGTIYPETLSISAVRNQDGSVRTYVGNFIDITKRKNAEALVEHMAFHDQLTDLPNRRRMVDRLRHASSASMRSGKRCALLLVDLDNFKVVNDTLGHALGDRLLKQTAARLESCLRGEDTLARFGGDEFLVLLEGLNEDTLEAASQAEHVGMKLAAALRQPYLLERHEIRIGCSIGVTVFGGQEQSTEELVKQADIAMYEAKRGGRNSLRFFDRKVQEQIAARAAMEEDLRNALAQGEIHLYYQMQVDSSNRPVGAEALVRWNHPKRGWVSPAEFIPLAEESDLILSIGHLVLETACARLAAWQNDPSTRELILAVNISAKQLAQDGFLDEVQAAVLRHSIDPAHLKLEITESMLLGDIEGTINAMAALKQRGLRISMDDFGTGYSSLSYLKRLPLDQLKIDQSFVRDIAVDPNDRAIVQTIIAMAKGLGLDVIAEGVETEAQRSFLLEKGCLSYQGYLFGKPVPVGEFEEALKELQGAEGRSACRDVLRSSVS